jgi:hypothetical protein
VGSVLDYARPTKANPAPVDVNGVAGAGISSFPNRRIDSRTGTVTDSSAGVNVDGTRTWPPYQPVPALLDVAALTGEAIDPAVAARPVLAVKIDNYATARPQWGLESADAVIELNVEGISRFIALFQSRLPAAIGPVRSARTEDFDLLSLMNRPIFAYSGANDGVLQWAGAADAAGVIVDFGAQLAPCYSRSPDKVGPHNLVLDTACAYTSVTTAGPARPMWRIDANWAVPPGASATQDTAFDVAMDGVAVQWRWDPTSGAYRRWQDGAPQVTVSGDTLSADTVAVLSVSYVPSVADARSPNAVTIGTGSAVIHRGGVAIDAIWSRATPYAPFQFFDKAVDRDLGHDAAHQRRDVAGSGGMSKRQPDMERNQARFRAGTQEHENQNQCNDEVGVAIDSDVGEAIAAARTGEEAEGEEQAKRAETRHNEIDETGPGVLLVAMMRHDESPGSQRHEFPGDEEGKRVVGENHEVHACEEGREEGKDSPRRFLMGAIA